MLNFQCYVGVPKFVSPFFAVITMKISGFVFKTKSLLNKLFVLNLNAIKKRFAVKNGESGIVHTMERKKSSKDETLCFVKLCYHLKVDVNHEWAFKVCCNLNTEIV